MTRFCTTVVCHGPLEITPEKRQDMLRAFHAARFDDIDAFLGHGYSWVVFGDGPGHIRAGTNMVHAPDEDELVAMAVRHNQDVAYVAMKASVH